MTNLNDYMHIRTILKESGIERPDMEARLLLEEFGSRDEILAVAINRRLAGEPLSRIIGYQEFWSLRFDLSPDTLDPRQDTETIVEAALERFTGNPPKRILDIGTGTGCILISLLHEWPETLGVGTDLAAGAVETARKNAIRNGVAGRAEFVNTRWAQGVTGKFDLILSNPPYIPTEVIPNLAANVKEFDPILALDGGRDGLDAYRAILTEMKSLLLPGGFALFEIGYDQATSMPRLVEEYGATLSRLVPDLTGIPRVVECQMGIS